MKKSPISRPQSLAATVADRIKAAILARELALGEALSEDKIATAMDVSRTPVREALAILQLQGLIVILPRRGSFVFQPSREDIRLLVEYRMNIELRAARLAVKHAPGGLHDAMVKALEDMVRAREADDALLYARADGDFHNAFFEHSHNYLFAEAYDIAAGRIAALRAHLSDELKLHRRMTYEEHQQMAEAVKARDPSKLCSILRAHISAMGPNYIHALEALRRGKPRLA
ncbi:DNA-binding transcriptional regulator, GntR family [Rhizobium sp. NFR07]|uniref:GntR family transcriptional regulator n=1 Tax=Rhizobium sp. NFR07 TaxID=1566262 RepID=UPI0008DFA575|nr:GntR family transcriptional regulator [Rhizobium sp. NFR07]SFB30719.1 DNA-binding transcriptional regulator, GntR family [Rhizobium sp. NFR07]